MQRCSRCRKYHNSTKYKTCNKCREYIKDRYNQTRIIKPLLYRECGRCKRFHISRTNNCSNCLLRRKNIYYQRKSMGLCPCGMFKQPGYIHCLKCKKLPQNKKNT